MMLAMIDFFCKKHYHSKYGANRVIDFELLINDVLQSYRLSIIM